MITSRQNARLKNIRRLRRCKGAALLLEGPHLVGEALTAGLRLDEVLASPEFLSSPEAAPLLSRLPTPPVAVEGGLLAELTDADSPKGLLAVASLPRTGVGLLPRVRGGVYLVLDHLQDPGNLGALARTAEAAGATAMALSPGTVHPNHPRALRASAGSLLRLPLAVETTIQEVESHLAGLDPRWVALVPRGGLDLWQAPLQGTLVVTLGAEGPGLSPALERRADLCITIPLAPPVESLNVTVAAAVTLFEIRRRRGMS